MDGNAQGTPEWHADRAGCFTASTFAALNYPRGKFKSGKRKGQDRPPPESRLDEIDRVVAELLTGEAKESVSARALAYGHEMEPEAMAAYEARTGRMVEVCGFIRHATHSFIGASPDFLVDEDGGGEIKCPMSIVVHATTLRAGLPAEHIEQIQGGLFVTQRQWWDFVSFNPKFPSGLDLYVQRVTRDEAVIARIEQDCLEAWAEVGKTIAKLKGEL